MCPRPGSAWPAGRRSRPPASSSWSGAIRSPRSPAARPRRAGRDLRRAVPRHRLDLGPPDLGHLVGMGRAADLDADPAVPLPRLHRARRAPSASAAAKGGIAAIFGLVGAINIPIIHYSVMWWRTLHQGQSITHRADRRSPRRFLWPLPLTTLGFSLIFGAVVLMRMRADLAAHQARGAAAPERPARMNHWPFVIAAYALTVARHARRWSRWAGGRCARPRPPPTRCARHDASKPKHQRLVLVVARAGRADRRGAARDVGRCKDRAAYFYMPSDIAASKAAPGQRDAARRNGRARARSSRDADGVTIDFIVSDGKARRAGALSRHRARPVPRRQRASSPKAACEPTAPSSPTISSPSMTSATCRRRWPNASARPRTPK